jgi:hypothetical protein
MRYQWLKQHEQELKDDTAIQRLFDEREAGVPFEDVKHVRSIELYSLKVVMIH